MVKDIKPISWEAEEYIQKNKNLWWYVALFAVGAILAAVAIWTGSWTFLLVVAISVLVIVVFSIRSPRKLKYLLDKTGLHEGDQLYKYEDYKAFGVLKENKHYSIVLIPKKRFGMRVKVYFPENTGEVLVDAFGARLPMEEVKLDFLDKLVSFLHL